MEKTKEMEAKITEITNYAMNEIEEFSKGSKTESSDKALLAMCVAHLMDQKQQNLFDEMLGRKKGEHFESLNQQLMHSAEIYSATEEFVEMVRKISTLYNVSTRSVVYEILQNIKDKTVFELYEVYERPVVDVMTERLENMELYYNCHDDFSKQICELVKGTILEQQTFWNVDDFFINDEWIGRISFEDYEPVFTKLFKGEYGMCQVTLITNINKLGLENEEADDVIIDFQVQHKGQLIHKTWISNELYKRLDE